jgi:hypothetical protein
VEPWSAWLARRVFEGRFYAIPHDPTSPFNNAPTYL